MTASPAIASIVAVDGEECLHCWIAASIKAFLAHHNLTLTPIEIADVATFHLGMVAGDLMGAVEERADRERCAFQLGEIAGKRIRRAIALRNPVGSA